MSKNYRIGHKDIAEIGYYFLDREQEEQYLTSVNDEYAMRVGEELTKKLENNNPDFEEILTRIRGEILEEIRETRKTVLVNI